MSEASGDRETLSEGDLEALEVLLGTRSRAPVRIEGWERIDPWYVFRCRLEPSPGLPSSVIVKRLRAHPTGFRTDRTQVATEEAALAFLAEHGPGLAPRLLASDRDAETLVLEDLAPRAPLSDALARGGVPTAREGLLAFARATAALHLATIAVPPGAPLRGTDGRLLGWRPDETRALGDALGVATEPAGSDIARAVGTLAEPGEFLALSNGDAGSNNFLVDGGDGRLIDFEFAGFRHALADIACFHVPGPMWMTVADPVATEMEERYRAALAAAVPEAGDDGRFGAGLAAACLAMALERVARLPRLDARAPGHDSRVQLVFTLEAAADAATRLRALPHLAGLARALATALRRRWPDADRDPSSYRAYTQRR